MWCPILLRAALVLCLPVAPAFAAQASPPHLRHSAPFVGQVLTLEVEGAAPFSPIALFFSPEAGSFPTPYGLLELRRDLVELLGSGTTSASGTWSFDLTVPLDPALAEAGAHFQALVADASAPAGRIFSDAVHARFLGSRVYAGYRGLGFPARTGLYFVSAATDSVVAQVDYGLTSEGPGARDEGKPVFDAAYSRGAVMSTRRELLLFDPFYGGVQGRVAFPSDCSRKLLIDAERRTVYVLELGGPSPARVHAIDLATGSATGFLDLPNTVEPLWCAGRAEAEAFVAEYEPGGRTAIRRVGLDPLVDLGSAPVGAKSNSFRGMVYAEDQVFVSTLDFDPIPWIGSLTRCRATPSGIRTLVTGLGPSQMYLLAAVPAADRLLAGSGRTDFGPAFWLSEVPLSTIGPPAAVPPPPGSGDLLMSAIEADGGRAWIVAAEEPDHPYYLYRLDVASHSWARPYPFNWWPFAPSDAEVLRDVWNHELWVSNKGYGPPIHIDPEILVVDELHSTSRRIPLDHTAEVLHAVALP